MRFFKILLSIVFLCTSCVCAASDNGWFRYNDFPECDTIPEPGTITWWLLYYSKIFGHKDYSRTKFAFSQSQIDATGNEIFMGVDKEKGLQYIKQAMIEADLVRADIDHLL